MLRQAGVICIGKTTIDQILTLNELRVKYHLDSKTGDLSFRHGEKIDVEQSKFCIGGNATNVAVGLSRLGVGASLFSEIGDDEFGLKIRNQLAGESIDASHIKQGKNTSSSFSVIINYRGERTIFMQKVQCENNFRFDGLEPDYIFLTSVEREWRQTYKNVLNLVVKEGCKLAFNPGTLQLQEGMDIVRQFLEHTDILFVNKEEAEQIVFGHEKRKRDNEADYVLGLLSKLKKMGVKCAIITNGKYGSHAIDEYGNFYNKGISPGELVERTGAGDAYNSGFLAAVIHGRNMKEAMRWGSVNSAAVIGKVGATAGLLRMKEMKERVG